MPHGRLTIARKTGECFYLIVPPMPAEVIIEVMVSSVRGKCVHSSIWAPHDVLIRRQLPEQQTEELHRALSRSREPEKVCGLDSNRGSADADRRPTGESSKDQNPLSTPEGRL